MPFWKFLSNVTLVMFYVHHPVSPALALQPSFTVFHVTPLPFHPLFVWVSWNQKTYYNIHTILLNMFSYFCSSSFLPQIIECPSHKHVHIPVVHVNGTLFDTILFSSPLGKLANDGSKRATLRKETGLHTASIRVNVERISHSFVSFVP